MDERRDRPREPGLEVRQLLGDTMVELVAFER